jgi:multisubunit Na+/H+ antiporter MnhE subunit
MAKRMQIGLRVALQGAVLFAVWLLIDDNVSQPELFTGIGVAILATALALLVTRSSTVRLRVRPGMFRYIYRPPLLLIADSVRVCGALIRSLVLRRPLRGSFRAVRYGAVADAPTDVARRALTEWSASVAPNRYVIGIDRDRRALLVHELVETHGPLDPLELG